MKKTDYWILLIILFVALLFRLYKINTPLADFHSWRQVDTSAVSRNLARDEFNLLYPRYDDLSNIQSGKENPEGYRFVEFPFYNALTALVYRSVPSVGIEVIGRLISIIFSLITIAIMYYLVIKEGNRWMAIASTLIYSVFPFFVFFSRTVLPESTALGLIFLSIFFIYLPIQTWKEKAELTGKNGIYTLLSVVFFALAVLVKPTIIFYSFTIGFLFLRKWEIKAFTSILPYAFFILGIIPFILWRWHISHFPEGIPASGWLITSVNTGSGLQPVFFRPAFFRWIFFERINNMIFGGFAFVFLVIGITRKGVNLFNYSLLFSAMVFLFIFQGGNVQHEYYQTLILPPLAIIAGAGIVHMLSSHKSLNLFVSIPVTIVLLGMGFFMSHYRVKDWYGTPQGLVDFSSAIQTYTSPDDWIVTESTGDTTLLYLSDRKGSPAVFKDLIDLKKKGYRYFATMDGNTILRLKEEAKHKLVHEDENGAIFSL